MPEIIIAVQNKLPILAGAAQHIVADNSDYTIRFLFDDQWEEGEKTVYFVRSNGYAYAPVKTVDGVVQVPVQTDVNLMSQLLIGVRQGDVKTSRPCGIAVYPAISDVIKDDAVQPGKSLWEQVLDRLDWLEENGGGGSGSGGGIYIGPEETMPAGTKVRIDPNGKKVEIREIDDTLTKQGYAADAKAVGEALKELNQPGAEVTAESIKTALGYTPADAEDVDELSEAIGDLKENPIPEETVKAAVDDYVTENGLGDAPIQLTAGQESAQLGEELISADGWDTTGWTGNFADGFTHVSGNTNPLVFTMPESTGTNRYQVTFTASDTLQTMELFVTVGNSPQFDLYGQHVWEGVGVESVEDGNLQFIPAEAFTGTISAISIKRILAPFDGIKTVMDSNESKSFEMRPTAAVQENLFAGNNSGQFNTSGRGNLGFGSDALANNTSGFWNVGLGYQALKTNTVGTRNIGIGYGSLLRNVCGHRNIGIGSFSLVNNLTGNWNISIGADSQDHLVSGDNNTGVGFSVLYHNQTGSQNTAFGASALMGATNPSRCTAVGYQAGYSNSGERNTAIGAHALMNVAGERNTGIGYMAGYGAANATAKSNIFIGMQAGYKVTSATSNIMIGASAGFNLTSGYTNIFIGNSTGNGVTSGADNILIGNGVDVDTNLGKSKNLNIGNLIKGWLKSGEMYAIINGGLSLPSIPTTDPAIAGRVWNDNGTLKISTGATA